MAGAKTKTAIHKSGYPLEMVKIVEAAGFDVAKAEDDEQGDMWYAFWNYDLDNPCPIEWASSCETIDDIYEALTNTRAVSFRDYRQ